MHELMLLPLITVSQVEYRKPCNITRLSRTCDACDYYTSNLKRMIDKNDRWRSGEMCVSLLRSEGSSLVATILLL